jgi:hypothetical protein
MYRGDLTLDAKVVSLFQPDPLLSIQFFATCRRKAYIEPEKLLILAVLEDAVACIEKYAGFSSGKRKRWFRETVEWIRAEDDEWVFSFNSVCEALGLDAGYLRAALMRMAEKEPARSRSPGSKKSLRKKSRERVVRAAA